MIGEVRRRSTQIAKKSGLDEELCGRAAIVATELATNLVAYAKDGEILIRGVPDAVEIIAFDHGPGMDIQRCMADGYSSGGTKGNGLGGVQRLSSDFDIYASERSGTAIMSRIVRTEGNRKSKRADQLAWSAISMPAPGEVECGDGWHIAAGKEVLSVLVADGLGHGPLAAIAAQAAITLFEHAPFERPDVYLEKAHGALSSTRGAAAAVAQVNLQSRNLNYSGIGNICGTILDHAGERKKPMLSHNGTVGIARSKSQGLAYQWNDGDILIMHSDGLTDRWKPENYRGLAQRDVSLVATVLYRDNKRGRDDATIVAVRLKATR